MKSTVFARPNLKMFLLGAIVLVIIQHLITSGQSQASALSKPLPANAREASNKELEELLKQAKQTPSANLYMRISYCYEKRGEYKKALLFLRRAEKIAQSEDTE